MTPTYLCHFAAYCDSAKHFEALLTGHSSDMEKTFGLVRGQQTKGLL